MLDYIKVMREIENMASNLFVGHMDQTELAFKKWQEIACISNFKERVTKSESSFLLPDWQQNLGQKICSISEVNHYAILAVDGSQIYPERHISGINCVLVNTGECLIEYGKNSRAKLTSKPKIFLSERIIPENDEKISHDIVDLKREELELKTSLEMATKLSQEFRKKNLPFVVFFDGSLIFWQLEGKNPNTKKYFLNAYIESLDEFYQKKIALASYISMPKSCELVNLTKIGFCRFEQANCIRCHSLYKTFPCRSVDHVLDANLCSKFLDRFERTIVFQSKSKIVEHYPSHLKPCFVYLNFGHEITRLEFPFWIAQDENSLSLICKVAIDQVNKGNGYPVALAEAHEQAVIRNTDREIFYNLICKKSSEFGQRVSMSQKAIKKHRSAF